MSGKPKRSNVFTGWSGVFIFINGVIVLFFTYHAGIKDFLEDYQEYSKPKLVLTLSPKTDVSIGDSVDLRFEAPTNGYMSLWNWTSDGKIKRMDPILHLNGRNNTGRYELRPTKQGMEHVYLVWSEQFNEHLTRDIYSSDRLFLSALEMNSDNIYSKASSVQVYK